MLFDCILLLLFYVLNFQNRPLSRFINTMVCVSSFQNLDETKFMPNGISYPYKLDESISNLRAVG